MTNKKQSTSTSKRTKKSYKLKKEKCKRRRIIKM